MLPRWLLLAALSLLLFTAVFGDQPTTSRQQRIVRRPPPDFQSSGRPTLSNPPRGGPSSGPRGGQGGSKAPLSPPPYRVNNPRPPPAAASNKKPLFIPPRQKLAQPSRPSEKSPPKVEYGFTPIVAPNSHGLPNRPSQDIQNTNPIQPTAETKKQLIINVQQPTSYQNHNQVKKNTPENFAGQFNPESQNGHHETFIKQHGNFGHPQQEKPKEQEHFEIFQHQQQNFGQNGKLNSEPFPKVPPNVGQFASENKNVKYNFDQFPKPPQNFNQQKVHGGSNFNSPGSFQTQHIPLSHTGKVPPQSSHFHFQNQRGQIQDQKVLNSGVQFHVQKPNLPGQIGQSQLPGNFGQEPKFPGNFGLEQRYFNNFRQEQKFPGNFGQDVKMNTHFIQHPKFHGQFPVGFNPEKSVDASVQFQVQQQPKGNQHFKPDVKLPPSFHQAQVQLPIVNQDPNFAVKNQFFLQDQKAPGIIPSGHLNDPQIKNQKLQAHYQVQETIGIPQLGFPNFPQYNIPAPQIFVQDNTRVPNQISIPVGTTFPFHVNPNPFLSKGIVQGQVIPVNHIGGSADGSIPQFTPLPQTLQFAGGESSEQQASSSQTRKVLAAPTNSSGSPAKPRKTTLKDILAEDCTGAEEFGYCASPPRYPTQQVSAVLKQCSEQLQQHLQPAPHHVAERAAEEPWSSSWADEGGESSAACVSTAAIVEPGYARHSGGHWLVVLQNAATGVQQRVTVDVCAHEGGSCGCKQHYENKNLVAWDPDRPSQCPTLKSFKFPTKCICPGEKTTA